MATKYFGKKEVMKKHNDVKFIGKNTIFIEKTVKLGKNVVIHPGNVICGNTEILDGAVLYPNNYIKDCIIGKSVQITQSNLECAKVESGSIIGPFARIRPGASIGENCKIGNFVEVKNSILGKGVKASHLAYIGDADIGDNVNIGCGVIFVNYNGRTKSKIQVGENSFIGSNVNLIAPINISKNSYICAGTTLTKNTENGDFVIGRVRETIKENLAKKYLKNFDKR